jgi:hypothetical protein
MTEQEPRGQGQPTVPAAQWKRQWVRRDPGEGEDPIFAAIENHRSAVAEKLACYAEAERLTLGMDWDAFTDGPFNLGWEAFDDFVKTVPSTLPGLLAMLAYAQDLIPADDRNLWSDSGSAETLIETFATAAKALMPAG